MRIQPSYYCPLVENIEVSFLKDKGIKGIAIDIDNTLTGDGSHNLKEGVANWIKAVKDEGIVFCIVSNNHLPRIKPYADRIEVEYICEADKPSARCKKELLEILGCNDSEVVMIGDQFFTDMLFASRCHFKSILVDPISEDKHKGAKIKRFFEKPLRNIAKKRRRI